MPIKNIIHRLDGIVGSKWNKDKYIDKITVHTNMDIIIVLVSFLCQTAVKTNNIMHVIGNA